MKKLLPALVSACLLVSNAFAADPLDFPNTNFRIKVGSLTQAYNAGGAAREIKIDGHMVKTGEVMINSVSVNWIVAPSVEVGDEYVFVVRRPNQKAKTYAAVFKGGFLTVASEGDLTIEIEQPEGVRF